jgi:hypothetical protein
MNHGESRNRQSVNQVIRAKTRGNRRSTKKTNEHLAIAGKFRTKSLKLWLAALITLIATPSFGEQVSINFGTTAAPLSHAGSGVLHSISAIMPSDDLLLPIKPQLFRAFPWGTAYDRAVQLGADYQVVVSDVYDYNTIFFQGGVLPGDNGDWSAWEKICRDMAAEALAQNKDIHFDIWNEADEGFFLEQKHTAMVRDMEARSKRYSRGESRSNHRWPKPAELLVLEHEHARVSDVCKGK